MDDNRLPKKINFKPEGEEIQEDHIRDGKMISGRKEHPLQFMMNFYYKLKNQFAYGELYDDGDDDNNNNNNNNT